MKFESSFRSIHTTSNEISRAIGIGTSEELNQYKDKKKQSNKCEGVEVDGIAISNKRMDGLNIRSVRGSFNILEHIKQMESTYCLETDERKLCLDKKIPIGKFRQIKERILSGAIRYGKVVKMDLLKECSLSDVGIVDAIAEFLSYKELIKLCKEVHKST